MPADPTKNQQKRTEANKFSQKNQRSQKPANPAQSKPCPQRPAEPKGKPDRPQGPVIFKGPLKQMWINIARISTAKKSHLIVFVKTLCYSGSIKLVRTDYYGYHREKK